jgi:hypothetical protein
MGLPESSAILMQGSAVVLERMRWKIHQHFSETEDPITPDDLPANADTSHVLHEP